MLHVVTSPYRFFKFLCFSVGFCVIAGVLAVSAYVWHAYRELPRLEELSFDGAKSLAIERVQSELEDKRAPHPWTELKDVSREFLYSIVMSEDSTFFEHDGFNFEAMIDSLAEDLKQRKAAYGASTLTQQVAKNLFLTRQKALERKLKEVWLTRGLERHFSKNQILELYLNLAEMGPDIYGVGAAARHYFHKRPDEINAAEGAFIALMLPSPRKNHYIIFENANLTKAKRRHIHRVLSDLLYSELITEDQYSDYLHYDYFGQGDARQPAERPAPPKRRGKGRR